MSDLQIYDTAWTQADVTFDYNNPQHLVTDNAASSIALSNLKGYWHLSEGDGAINYDSSGEGNDGTINGATWEDQQATIPQLGLMDWSKGSNVLTQSNGFNASPWVATDISLAYGETAPDGTATAYKVTQTGGSGTGMLYNYVGLNVGVIRSIWAKTVSGTGDVHLTSQNGNSNSLFTITNQWQRFSVASGSSAAVNFYAVDFRGSSTLTEVIIWGAQEEVNTTDPLSAYRLTNGTAVTDATLIANPNNPSEDILGNSVRLREHSLNLDGSGYAEVPDADNLDVTNYSIDGWFYSTNNSSGWEAILTKLTQDNFEIYIRNSQLRYFNSTDSEKLLASISLNAWTYFCITESGGTLKCYINDDTTPKSSQTVTQKFANTGSVYIGSHQSGDYSNALIDDVRIYNRALSSDEVEQNYKAGLNKHKASSSFSDDFSSDYGF
jgi:hypothetical protein